jgi:hypothetical protein
LACWSSQHPLLQLLLQYLGYARLLLRFLMLLMQRPVPGCRLHLLLHPHQAVPHQLQHLLPLLLLQQQQQLLPHQPQPYHPQQVRLHHLLLLSTQHLDLLLLHLHPLLLHQSQLYHLLQLLPASVSPYSTLQSATL